MDAESTSKPSQVDLTDEGASKTKNAFSELMNPKSKKQKKSTPAENTQIHASDCENQKLDNNIPVVNSFALLMQNAQKNPDAPPSSPKSKQNSSKSKKKVDSPKPEKVHQSDQPSSPVSTSRFVECEKCGKSILIFQLSSHQELDCKQFAEKQLQKKPEPPPEPLPEKPVKQVILKPLPASAFSKKRSRGSMSSPLNPPIHETFSLTYHKDPVTNIVNWKWTFSKSEKTLSTESNNNNQENKKDIIDEQQRELNTSVGSTESTKEAMESLLYIKNQYHSDSDENEQPKEDIQPFQGFSTARGKKIQLQTDLTNESVVNRLKRKFELEDNKEEQEPTQVAFMSAKNLFQQNVEKKENTPKVPTQPDKPGHTLGLWSEEVSIRDRAASRDVIIKMESNIQSADDDSSLAWRSRSYLQHDPLHAKSMHLPPSILKSVIQKNVRLCRPIQAVKSSLHFIQEDFNGFIRRLSIIMIEDAILHPALPLVVWLTLATSKGFVPSTPHIDACLNIVCELAAVECKDEIPLHLLDTGVAQETFENHVQAHLKVQGLNHSDEGTDNLVSDLSAALVNRKKLFMSKSQDPPSFQSINETFSEPSKQNEGFLIKCILARASFGGMIGDVAMLRNFATVWFHRFANSDDKYPAPNLQYLNNSNNNVNNNTSPNNGWSEFLHAIYGKVHKNISYKMVGPMMPEDATPSSVDFHCSSILEHLLQNTSRKTFVEEYLHRVYGTKVEVLHKLQQMMWWFRSSKNVKKSIQHFLDLGKNPDETSVPIDENQEEKEKLIGLFQQLREYLDDYSQQFLNRRYY